MIIKSVSTLKSTYFNSTVSKTRTKHLNSQLQTTSSQSLLAQQLGINKPAWRIPYPLETTISKLPPQKFFRKYIPTGSFQGHPTESYIQESIQALASQAQNIDPKRPWTIQISANPQNGLNTPTLLASIQAESTKENFHIVLNPPKSFRPPANTLIFPKTSIIDLKAKQEQFTGGVGNWCLLPYSLMAIQHLSTLNLQGQHVIDFGSGDGILALYALKAGAGHVTCFEKTPKFRQSAIAFLKANNIDAKRVTFKITDLGSLNSTQEIPNDATIAIANLGEFYGSLDAQCALLALAECKDLTHFIGSGYSWPPENRIQTLPETMALLSSYGFSEWQTSQANPTTSPSGGRDLQLTSFMASRIN